MEMAHSVEGRVPFLDHHVVECVCRAPVCLKIRGVTEKYLLREAAKPLITETVYRRQKHPFLSPPVTAVPAEGFYQMMQDVLRGSVLDELSAMSEVERVCWDPILMSVLSACVLQERFRLGSKAFDKYVLAIHSHPKMAREVGAASPAA
jgi:asparagine synthase (glutamine-hydrolysing)